MDNPRIFRSSIQEIRSSNTAFTSCTTSTPSAAMRVDVLRISCSLFVPSFLLLRKCVISFQSLYFSSLLIGFPFVDTSPRFPLYHIIKIQAISSRFPPRHGVFCFECSPPQHFDFAFCSCDLSLASSFRHAKRRPPLKPSINGSRLSAEECGVRQQES